MRSGVYLLKCPYEGRDMLKIGFSKDVKKRVKAHMTSNPFVEKLGYIKTDKYKELEKQIHYKCRNLRYKNTEWFRDNGIIIDFFKTHKDYVLL